MRRLPTLFLVAIIVAITYVIAQQQGHATIVWRDLRIDLSVAKLIAAILIAALVAALLFSLLRRVLGGPAALWRARRERRRRAGYRALTQGMVAVAAGDAQEAQRHARKADLYLADPPLTLLLSAQAAQLQGDENAARRYFNAMLERPETEFLGLRGLITMALREGDEDGALRLAQRAHQLRPETPWVRTSLLEIQTRRGEWAAAQTTLTQRGRGKGLFRTASPPETRRQLAALGVQRSRTALAAGEAGEALGHAERARKLAGDFPPAVAQHAELLLRQDQPAKAAKIIEAAWKRAPHPQLAALYGRIYAGEAPLARVKRFERLAALSPDHPESHLALAEAALAAQLWGEARRHLAAASAGATTRVESGGAALPSARICRQMAALEEAEHGDGAAARAWLARASMAPPDPVYLCRHCGAESLEWQPLCPRCRAFDSLVWEVPARALPAISILGPAAEPIAVRPVAASSSMSGSSAAVAPGERRAPPAAETAAEAAAPSEDETPARPQFARSSESSGRPVDAADA